MPIPLVTPMNFIYALTCPFDGVVRYIGKTRYPGHRLQQHIKKAEKGHTKHHCANWLQSLTKRGATPELKTLCALPDDADWQAVERLLIAFAKYAELPITNTTVGGEGVVFVDEEAKARQVEIRRLTMSNPDVRDRWLGNLREAFKRPETQQKRSASLSRIWANSELREKYLAGMNSPEGRQRRIKASLERWSSQQHREIHAAAMQEARQRPEVMEKMMQSLEACWSSPEIQARRIAGIKASHATPETKAKISAASIRAHANPETIARKSQSLKAHWANEDERAAHLAALAKPEVRATMSTSAKAAWSDPAKAANRKSAMKAAWADPDKKAKALAKRTAKWADPVQRAVLIEQQKASWVKRKAKKES